MLQYKRGAHSLGIVGIDHQNLQKNCTLFRYVLCSPLYSLLILAQFNWNSLAGKEACPHCRKLITRINLPRHIRVQHMDSEPSECPQCFKVFKSSYNMKEHQRTAHGILQKCLLWEYCCRWQSEMCSLWEIFPPGQSDQAHRACSYGTAVFHVSPMWQEL